MSLIPVDAEYHYVQDTTPSEANAGDVWLDTSSDPPISKIYADVGNGLEWLQDQSSNRIEQNLDAKVSSAGTTQDTIADGADESEGRWSILFEGGLAVSAPETISAVGSGAAPSFITWGVTISGGGTDGDYGALQTTMGAPQGNPNTLTGSTLYKVRYQCQTPIGSLGDIHVLGFSSDGDNPGTNRNIAVFRPTVGDSTSGNVRVDSDDTITDGSVTYPAIDEPHEYTILIDEAGNYLTAGHTGFYIDGDPREGDSPDADLAATPEASFRRAGAFYASEGNGDQMGIGYLEVAVR